MGQHIKMLIQFSWQMLAAYKRDWKQGHCTPIPYNLKNKETHKYEDVLGWDIKTELFKGWGIKAELFKGQGIN